MAFIVASNYCNFEFVNMYEKKTIAILFINFDLVTLSFSDQSLSMQNFILFVDG